MERSVVTADTVSESNIVFIKLYASVKLQANISDIPELRQDGVDIGRKKGSGRMAKAPTMDEWAEKLGTKALNGFVYEGRTLREWIDLMASGYCVVLSDRATNGDVVKAVFPNLEQDKERLRQKYGSQALYDTFEKWCELPYKVGDTDGTEIHN